MTPSQVCGTVTLDVSHHQLALALAIDEVREGVDSLTFRTLAAGGMLKGAAKLGGVLRTHGLNEPDYAILRPLRVDLGVRRWGELFGQPSARKYKVCVVRMPS
jgi:hypothetical protein